MWSLPICNLDGVVDCEPICEGFKYPLIVSDGILNFLLLPITRSLVVYIVKDEK